jgi:glycosyltransferase involved in cell wall biosynthesis
VTVVVHSNGRGDLDGTIRSVLGQSLSDIEVFVAVRGIRVSPELSALAETDPRLLIRMHAPNDLSSRLRNRCIERSRGLFIAFLEEGDRWHPEKLRRQVEFMRRHPEYALTFTASEGTGFEEPVEGKSERIRDDRDAIVNALTRGEGIPLSTVMVRRSALRFFGGFDESPRLRGASDYDLWVRIAMRGDGIRGIDEPLARLARSTRPWEREWRRLALKRGSALRRFRRLHPSIPASQQRLIRNCLARTFRSLGGICLLESHRLRSRRYLRNSIRTCPVQVRSYLLFVLSFFHAGLSTRILRKSLPSD